LNPVGKTIQYYRNDNHDYKQLQNWVVLNPSQGHHRDFLQLFFQAEFHPKQYAFGEDYDSVPDGQLDDPCFVVDDVNKVVFGLTLFRNVGGFLFL
jgi:hypothetical protein